MDEKTTLLKKTDFLQKIVDARYKKVVELMGFPDEVVEGILEKKKGFRMTLPRKSKLTPTLWINTPRFGDVEGVRMQVKATPSIKGKACSMAACEIEKNALVPS